MAALISEYGLGDADAQRLKMARWLQVLQLGTAVVLLPILYLIGRRLPVQAGWENGPLEMTQNVLLALAVLSSTGMALARRDHVQRFFWVATALVWLLLLGRELSWGAVFVAPLTQDPIAGPFYSSRVLGYRPYIAWVGGLAMGLVLLLLWRAQVWSLMRLAWQRRALMPFGAILAAFIYGLVATFAEKNGKSMVPNAQVMEELFETGAYFFLLRAQWWAFRRWLKP